MLQNMTSMDGWREGRSGVQEGKECMFAVEHSTVENIIIDSLIVFAVDIH